MPALNLDIIVVPTYSTLTLGVADASTYPTNPPIVTAPTIEITVPSLGVVILPFTPNDFNIFTSASLGLTLVGEPLLPIPDGIYTLKYTVAPAYENFVVKSIMRVDKIQEKFDGAFMKLDMMECDRAIKTQQKVNLTSIYFFIQGSIAAANNCAIDEANKLYTQANNMLDNFIRNNCYCSGNNYVVNFG
jgi:hypothetical protein